MNPRIDPDITSFSAALRIAGVVDTHYHVGPELLPRKYDVKTLAQAAEPWRATLVLKNHTYSTTPLAALARAHFGAKFFGSVVLNRFVGGLTPEAVEGAVSGNRAKTTETQADPSPIVVWMPTVHAASHLRTNGHAFDPRWSGCCQHRHGDGEAHIDREAQLPEPVLAFDDNLRPTPGLLRTLEAIVRHHCVLATGHLCADEVMALVPLAVAMGVHRIIVTHPDYPSVNLGIGQQRQLALHPEVFIEHCFAVHTIEEVPLERYAQAILATGPEKVLLSTDFGQVFSDPFPLGTIRFALALWKLLETAIPQSVFLSMFSANGRRALDLPIEV